MPDSSYFTYEHEQKKKKKVLQCQLIRFCSVWKLKFQYKNGTFSLFAYK